MSFTCPKCNEYRVIANTCNCKRFECAIPWQGAVSPCSWDQVYAYDAEAAAEKYAEEYDSNGDYTIIRNGTGEVWVRAADDTTTRWSIEAESVPEYRAYELEFPAATESGFPDAKGAEPNGN